MTTEALTSTQRAPAVRVLDVLRSRALPGEPDLLTVTRAVKAFRRGEVTDRASARVAQVAHVLKSYLVRVTEETSIAWALALLEVPAQVLEAHEGDGGVRAMVARSRDWAASEVEAVCKVYARDLRGGWPECGAVLDGLRANRKRYVEQVRQDLTLTALPAKTAPGAWEDERAEAAREKAMAEVKRAFAKMGVK